jgi:hypothetical protein
VRERIYSNVPLTAEKKDKAVGAAPDFQYSRIIGDRQYSLQSLTDSL